MKSVLMSIQPKWCELIASGKKTIEVRKTRPKIETPFKCYIYETKDKKFENIGFHYADGRKDFIHHIGKVIGEFVCDRIRCEREVADGLVDVVFAETSCVSYKELIRYANGKVLYSLHISDLVIYDKPKELSEFRKPCMFEYDCFLCKQWDRERLKCLYDDEIKKPPQSWCYVWDGRVTKCY